MNRSPAATAGLVMCALLGALQVTASLAGVAGVGSFALWRVLRALVHAGDVAA